MSEAGTQQFDASVPPMAGVTYQGDLGPNIKGSGTMSFYGAGIPTLWLYFAQMGQSQASYGNNFGPPNTPLQPGTWTLIQNPSNLIVAYNANGGDLKLTFAW